MTTTPTAVFVQPDEGSRLEQLLAQYGAAKAVADEAAKRLKDITDGIKSELTEQKPDGATSVDVISPAGPLRMSFVESWRVDSKRLKAEQPELYVAYAVKSGMWKLQAVKP